MPSTVEKRCKDCAAEKRPLTRPAPYVGPRCKTHHYARRRAVRLASAEKRVEKTYGLSPEQYNKLYAAQGGKCAICRRATGATRRLSVDHDHTCCPGPVSCGKCARGLLCRHCNRDIVGYLRDSPEAFDRGADYLRHWPSRQAGIVP